MVSPPALTRLLTSAISALTLGIGLREHLDNRQVVIMGRVTYQVLARFSASATDEVSARMDNLPKIVCSSTLQEPLAWKNTRLIKGALADEIKALKHQGGDLSDPSAALVW